MSILTTKLLSLFLYPLSEAILGLLIAMLLLWNGRWRWGRGLSLLSIAWLWIWATPWASNAIGRALEQPYPPQNAEHVPKADAILVLGGGVGGTVPGGRYPELGQSADRVWHAARLYHAGRAPLIVASGGNVPWRDAGATEAEGMRAFLLDLGVPEGALRIEGASRNTRENLLHARRVLNDVKGSRMLLVTSAAHMRRALAEAQAVGIEAIPAATDHEYLHAASARFNALEVLPSADALLGSQRAFKEYVGYWRLRLSAARDG